MIEEEMLEIKEKIGYLARIIRLYAKVNMNGFFEGVLDFRDETKVSTYTIYKHFREAKYLKYKGKFEDANYMIGKCFALRMRMEGKDPIAVLHEIISLSREKLNESLKAGFQRSWSYPKDEIATELSSPQGIDVKTPEGAARWLGQAYGLIYYPGPVETHEGRAVALGILGFLLSFILGFVLIFINTGVGVMTILLGIILLVLAATVKPNFWTL